MSNSLGKIVETSNWESAVAILLLALGTVALALTLRPDLWSFSRSGQTGPLIATLTGPSGDVRVRPTSSFIWKTVARKDIGLTDGDTVFTGAASRASLTLLGGSEFDLVSSSLIVVHEAPALENGGADFNLSSGKDQYFQFEGKRVQLSSKAGSASALVRMIGDGEGRELRISSRGAAIVVQMPEVHASPFEVAENRVFVFQPAKTFASVRESGEDILTPPRAIGPVDGATILIPQTTKSDSFSILLSWENMSQSSETEVEIENETVKVSGPANRLARTLKIGTYSWRLKSRLGARVSEASAWRKFEIRKSGLSENPNALAKIIEKSLVGEVILLPAVRIHAPQSSTRLFSERDLEELDVELHWKPVAEATDYLIRIIGKGAKGDTLQELKAEGTLIPVHLKDLESTVYQFEIEARRTNGENAQSKRALLSLPMAEPLLKLPLADARLTQNLPTLFTWEKTALTVSYWFQVAKNTKFYPLIVSEELKDNAQSLTPDAKGKYFWRVRALAEPEASPWSAVRSFTVE